MVFNTLKKLSPITLLAVGLLACVAIAAAPVEPFQIPVPGLVAQRNDPPPAKVDPQPLLTGKRDPQKGDSQPLPKGPNKLMLFNDRDVSLFDPDGQNEKKLSGQLKDFPAEMVIGDPAVREDKLWLSPDGKRLAAVMFTKRRGGFAYGSRPGSLYVVDLAGNAQWVDLKHRCLTAAWSADGNRIATTDWDTASRPGKRRQTTSYLIDVKTKEKEKVNLPDNHVITDWTRDGKRLLTYSIILKDNRPNWEMTRLHLMNRDGTEHKALTETKLNVRSGRISPDETRVLCIHPTEDPTNPRRGDIELLVLDIATGKTTRVGELPERALLCGFCWSPDGKQIAYAYAWWEANKEAPARAPEEIGSYVVVCDVDGTNPKAVVTRKIPPGTGYPITGVDWR